jgi:hypothetical protein
MHRRLPVRCARAVVAIVALVTLLSVMGGSASTAATPPAASADAQSGGALLDDDAVAVARPVSPASRHQDAARLPSGILGVPRWRRPPRAASLPVRYGPDGARPGRELHPTAPRRGPPGVPAA